MSDEKDRFGDTLRDKEKGEEDQYFAELSQRHLEKLRHAQGTAAETAKNGCPRCGAPLAVTQHKGVAVDACSKGCGIWLDASQLEAFTTRAGETWLSRLLPGSRL
ncbi:MAG: zf-TFIIB domain-containing protein [Candidatus Binatia bacterium]